MSPRSPLSNLRPAILDSWPLRGPTQIKINVAQVGDKEILPSQMDWPAAKCTHGAFQIEGANQSLVVTQLPATVRRQRWEDPRLEQQNANLSLPPNRPAQFGSTKHGRADHIQVTEDLADGSSTKMSVW